MKKIMFFLLLIGLLGIGASVFFLVTFDADRLRPVLVEQIEKHLGSAVTLERVELAWRHGIALELRELEIYPAKDRGANPIVRVKTARALLQIMPLLRRSLRIGALEIIRPEVRLVREPDGRIMLPGLVLPRNEKQSGSGAAVSLPFLIDRFSVESGQVSVEWRDSEKISKLNIQQFDLDLSNVSLTGPVKVEGKLAIGSDTQNVAFKGRVRPLLSKKTAVIDGAVVQIDLALVSHPFVKHLLGADSPLETLESSSGRLNVKVEHLELTKEGLEALESEVLISNGRIRSKDLLYPVTDIEARVRTEKRRFYLEDFSAVLGNGKLGVSGTVELLEYQPKTSLTLEAQGFRVEELVPAGPAGAPRLYGEVDLMLEGTAFGMDADAAAKSFSAGGKVIVRSCVLKNMNLLKEVFNQISVIPRLKQRLDETLPESYKKKFEQRDTVFKNFQWPLQVAQGQVKVGSLVLATEELEVNGRASVDLQGRIGGTAMVKIEPELSAALIRSVEELKYLLDQDARVNIPIRVAGSVERPIVIPDVGFLAQKAVVATATQLFSQFLEKKAD